MEQLGFYWTDFHIIWYLSIFSIFFPKNFKFNLKFDKGTGALHADLCIFMITSCLILLRIRNVSEKATVKVKTHLIFSNFFFNENSAFYEMK